jgi:cystathionine beta-lyase/cystathionine gamma-synthase
VFDNAEEVVAYNEGRSSKFLYSRYTNPTVISAEKQLAALDRAESALVFSSGQGATTTLLMTHVKAGDEVVCSAANLELRTRCKITLTGPVLEQPTRVLAEGHSSRFTAPRPSGRPFSATRNRNFATCS